MANDLNQCNFIGRLGVDPEIRYLPQGGAVANFSIACNWKSKDKEGSEWIKIVAYERLAEICGEYLKKGSKVFISGKQRTRKWQDQQGVERYTTEIIANEMQMLDGKQENQSSNGQATVKQSQQQPQQRQQPQQGFNQPQQPRQAPPQGYQGQMPQQRAPMEPPIDFDQDITF